MIVVQLGIGIGMGVSYINVGRAVCGVRCAVDIQFTAIAFSLVRFYYRAGAVASCLRARVYIAHCCANCSNLSLLCRSSDPLLWALPAALGDKAAATAEEEDGEALEALEAPATLYPKKVDRSC